MNTILTAMAPYFFSVVFPLIIFLLLKRPATVFANKVGLVDNPNERKLHIGEIPLVGGILIFLSVFITNFLVNNFLDEWVFFQNYFFAGGLLLLMGLLDDRFDVKAVIKLLFQLSLALFAFYNGIRVESLNGILGFYEISFVAQLLITVLGITGFINAFNLMDGVDGLASGFAFLTLSLFSILNLILGNYTESLLLISLCTALIVFFKFNVGPKKSKIFLGDAGSLFLGFTIVIAAISLLNSSTVLESNLYFALVIVALSIPMIDSIRVYIFRINKGRSPFRADRSHFHHLMVEAGVKPVKASAIIIGYSFLMISISIILINYLSINAFLIALIVSFTVFVMLLNFNLKISMWKVRIREMEKKN